MTDHACASARRKLPSFSRAAHNLAPSQLAGSPWDDPAVPLVVLDLASVSTYLLVSRLSEVAIEQRGALWCPLISPPGPLDLDPRAAKDLADALGLPLEQSPEHPRSLPATMRLATLAAARGKGALFMIRATRLAWSTGADLDALFRPGHSDGFSPEEHERDGYLPLIAHDIGISVDQAMQAAEDRSPWDVELHLLAQALEQVGIETAPTLRWQGQLHVGFDAISAFLSAPAGLQATAN
jgi:2-hydroxychromene-2-carboxylate isomerase